MTNVDNMKINDLFKYIKTYVDEKYPYDEKYLQRISKEFLELLTIRLIKTERFFASYIMASIKVIDLDLVAPAAVNITNGVVNLYFNPILTFKLPEVSLEFIQAILIHEYYHIINLHLSRSKFHRDQNHVMANYAMDCAINQYIPLLNESKHAINPKTLSEIFNLNENEVELKREYEYYLELIMTSDKYKEIQKKQEEALNKLNDLMDKVGSGEATSTDMEEIGDILEELVEAGNISIDHGKWDDMESHDIDTLKETVKKLTEHAVSEARGNIPGGIKELLDKLNQPPILHWTEILDRAYRSLKSGKRKTRTRLNRRQPNRFDIRGETSNRESNIVIAIDTSASMNVEELEYSFNEIFSIIKNRKNTIHIIEADTEVTKHYLVRNLQDVDMEIVGRGGTSFTPTFRFIKEKKINPDIVIYFTDGGGESSVDKKYLTHGTTYLFVLTGLSSHLSVSDEPRFLTAELDVFGKNKKDRW